MIDTIFISRLDGTEQRYVTIRPPDSDRPAPRDVLIALHGHGSDRWQFARDPRDECRAARDVAAAHRMFYVSPDYRAPTSWMGPTAEADLVQIIDEVRAGHPVARVFLCGGSMGGTSSLIFGVRHPDLIAGIASMNGTANMVEYGNFQEAIAESYGGSKAQVPDEYRNRSAEFWPERLTMPVGITASGQDTSVPPDSVLRLGKALERINRNVLVIYREEAGHVTSYADARAILEFVIARALLPSPSR
jgi:pimeloyl-ACP methyl ester carboxylesterase